MRRAVSARPEPRVFAALGDPVRLGLVERLRERPRSSITTLAEGTAISRQGVTKHLRVLADAGLVRDERVGREHLWSVDPRPLADVARWLDAWRREWDGRLDRLDAFLSEPASKNPR